MFLRSLFLNIAVFIMSIYPVPTYTEGVVGQPTSFLPSKTQTQQDRSISNLVYRGLFKYDIYGVLVPDLADTWTVNDDGITYTVKLKSNQFWSDGSIIKADDLIYTSYKVSDLAGVATDKVDDLTVKYTLPNKYSPFLSLLSIGVMKADAEEKEKPLKPITSGDWKIGRVERVGRRVSKIVLLSNNEKFKIKKIVFSYYPNEDEVTTAAKLGEINGFVSNSRVELPGFADHKFPLQGISYALFFNLNNEALKDLAFRQKLQKVLHTDELIFDKGISVEGAISRSVFTDRNLKFDNYDAGFREDLANQKISITVPDIAQHLELANKIKEIWEDRLSLDVTINKVEPDKIINDVVNPRNFEILLYGQESGRDPDRYVNWHSTQKVAPGLNITSFEQVRADRALEEGRKELENDKRMIHYNEFQKTINDNIPAIFLYHPFIHYYISNYYTGIGEKYTFTQADRFLDLINWKRVETN